LRGVQKNSTEFKSVQANAASSMRRHSGVTSALGGSQCAVMRRRRKGFTSGAYIHAYLILPQETVSLCTNINFFILIFFSLL